MEVIVKGQPSIEIGFETKVIQVGGLGDIDSALSTESENPVQNKVITAEFESVHTELDSQNELIEDLQNTKIDRENDDYYPKMAVGLADNLSSVDVVDSEINFRRSGGGAISDGVARIEAIKGNSVVWNQVFVPYKANIGTKVINGVTYTMTAEGSVTAEGTAEGSNAVFVLSFLKLIKDHKYLIVAPSFTGSWSDKEIYVNGYTSNDNYSGMTTKGYAIITATNTAGASLVLTTWTDKTISASTRIIVCDLTQMFGAGNEPTMIEEFYSRIPMGVDLNAYNEGEVIHMDVQRVESQGVNAWDEEWEVGVLLESDGQKYIDNQVNSIRSKNYNRCLPNTKYYVKSDAVRYVRVFWYDINKEYLGFNGAYYGAKELQSPTNAAFFKLSPIQNYGKTYNNDICINISDTSINGKYFPYIKRVEDLSIIRKYFPQGMKSAGTAHDEIRYNKATQKWEMVQKIGEADLGVQNWIQDTDNTRYRFEASTLKIAYGTNLFCAKYPSAGTMMPSQMADKSICISNSATLPLVRIKDSNYTDAATFKAAMSGVILYYELAEPIVTELDAEDQFRDLDYQVWNCGTEKAIAEGKSAPLAADITYGFNAIGKIKELESLVAALRAKVGI